MLKFCSQNIIVHKNNTNFK